MDISVRPVGEWKAEDRSWLASKDGTAHSRTVTLDTSAFDKTTHYPDGYVKSGTVLAKLDNGMYGPYAASPSESQTLTVTGSPTGGTFTITFDGATTAAIPYNATAAAVQNALEALPNVSPGDVTVTGAGGGPWTVAFGGQYTGANVPAMTSSGAGLTGGTSPAVAVATVGAGGGGTGTGGASTAEGFLFSSEEMREGGPDVGAALQWRGVIRVGRLPANAGLDAAARRDLAAHFRFE